MLLAEMIYKPQQAMRFEALAPRLTWRGAITIYALFLVVDVLCISHIGARMPGGNPMLWALDGMWYEFEFVNNWFPAQGGSFNTSLFLAALAYKAIADGFLILAPALNAKYVYGADISNFTHWAKGYLYLLGACDIFLILGMLPWFAYEFGVINISAQRAAVATHLIEIWVAGLNLVLFGFWYAQAFRLSFQQAYVGWFALNIVPAVLLAVVLLLCVP